MNVTDNRGVIDTWNLRLELGRKLRQLRTCLGMLS